MKLRPPGLTRPDTLFPYTTLFRPNVRAGRAMARELDRTFKPEAVFGFGGYPALPALLAAFKAGVPTAIHEQNAVLGRVNRLVARKVDAIATSYAEVDRLDAKYADKEDGRASCRERVCQDV